MEKKNGFMPFLVKWKDIQPMFATQNSHSAEWCLINASEAQDQILSKTSGKYDWNI